MNDNRNNGRSFFINEYYNFDIHKSRLYIWIIRKILCEMIKNCIGEAMIKGSDNHFLLAHLSQRLIGKLIGYPWSGVRRRPSSIRPFTISNVFFSETAWPIKANLYVEPPWEGRTIVYINRPGHMTKMAALPIYGKNLKKSSSLEPEGL